MGMNRYSEVLTLFRQHGIEAILIFFLRSLVNITPLHLNLCILLFICLHSNSIRIYGSYIYMHRDRICDFSLADFDWHTVKEINTVDFFDYDQKYTEFFMYLTFYVKKKPNHQWYIINYEGIKFNNNVCSSFNEFEIFSHLLQ